MNADPESHPALALNETTHQRVRLGILAVLAEAAECTFPTLRDQLELTDGNLSRHLKILEEAGLVEVRKTFEDKRPRTWLKLTKQGRKSLRSQLELMEQLLARLDSTMERD